MCRTRRDVPETSDSDAAPSKVATAYTTCALVGDKSCSSSSVSALDSRSLLERNPPPPPSGFKTKLSERLREEGK